MAMDGKPASTSARSPPTSRRCASSSAAARCWPRSRPTDTATASSRPPGRAGRRGGLAGRGRPGRGGRAAPGGITAPVLCMMAFGDPTEAVRHEIDLAAGSPRPSRRSRPRRSGPASGPGSTSRPIPGSAAASPPRPTRRPWRRPRSRPRPAARSGSPGCGPISPAPTSPDTRLSRPSSTRAPTPWRSPRRRGHPRGQAHRQHRRRADRPGVPAGPGALRRGGLRPATLPGGAPWWLGPALTLRARLAMVKRGPRVPASPTATGT